MIQTLSVEVWREDKKDWVTAPKDKKGNYKSYVLWEKDEKCGVAERLKIAVEVKQPLANAVLWEMYDIDDPASHIDVDPNDWARPPWAATIISAPKGGDNTGVRHPKKNLKWFQRADHNIIRYQENLREQKGIRKISPRFPLDVLKDYSHTFAITEIDADSKSSILFQPSNDGGDNFRIRAVPVMRDIVPPWVELCCGVSIPIVVWRRVEVRTYAMKSDSKDFYPGKSLESLQKRFSEAFTDEDDPDRNCYIEIKIIDKDEAGNKLFMKYQEEFWFDEQGNWEVIENGKTVDTVMNIRCHKYTADSNNYLIPNTKYHKDGLSHPIDTVQLIGADAEVSRPIVRAVARGLGFAFPLPHSFVFTGRIEKIFGKIPSPLRGSLDFPWVEECYRLEPGAQLKIHFEHSGQECTATVQFDKEEYTPEELKDLIKDAIKDVPDPPDWLRSVKVDWDIEGVSSAWDKDNGKKFKFTYIKRSADIRIKFSGTKSIIKILQLNEEYPTWQDIAELTAVHEVGHALYNAAGELGKKWDLTKLDDRLEISKLGARYHGQRISEGSKSVSSGGGSSLYGKFSPLIARDFRCSIFRFYKGDINEEKYNGSPYSD